MLDENLLYIMILESAYRVFSQLSGRSCIKRRPQSVFTVVLVATMFHPQMLMADENLPDLTDVLQKMMLNTAKLTNGVVSLRSVVIADKESFRGTLLENPSPHLLIGSRFALVIRQKIIFGEENDVSSVSRINVQSARNTYNVNTTWTDYANKVRVTLIEREEGILPNGNIVLNNDGEALVKRESIQDSNENRVLRALQISSAKPSISSKATVIGKEKYRGLECLDVRWKGTANNYTARVLVCPSRDYRILYRESNLVFPNKTAVTETYAVESIKQFEDVWLPTQVREERRSTYADGVSASQITKSWVTDFQPNSLNFASVFTPSFAPSLPVQDFTRSIEGKTPATSIVGGDATSLIRKLHSGDFSMANEEKRELS